MRMLDAPNYTQIPNILLDTIFRDMGEAELRVLLAVCRKTLGWQKDKDRISLTQLEKITGLSRQGVINGINDAVGHGFVERLPVGQSFTYELILTSQPSGLELVNEVDQLGDKLVNEVDIQKKVNLNKEINTQPEKAPVVGISAFTGLPLKVQVKSDMEGSRERIKTLVDEAMFAKRNTCGEYPEGLRAALAEFNRLWKIDPPGRKSKQYGYWINCTKEMIESMGEYGLEVIGEYFIEWQKQPYQVNTPGSIAGSMRAYVGRKRAGKVEAMAVTYSIENEAGEWETVRI